jgi:hypothetical protein
MQKCPKGLKIAESPVKFPENRGIYSGDRFAYDCAHHQVLQEINDLGLRTFRGDAFLLFGSHRGHEMPFDPGSIEIFYRLIRPGRGHWR